ncbi:MAG: hypothetical protein WKF47_03765 [Geodermatophilaceae bacterium]
MQLAVELGPRIRVNALAPAVVKTKFATALYEGEEDAVGGGVSAQAARRTARTSPPRRRSCSRRTPAG